MKPIVSIEAKVPPKVRPFYHAVKSLQTNLYDIAKLVDESAKAARKSSTSAGPVRKSPPNRDVLLKKIADVQVAVHTARAGMMVVGPVFMSRILAPKERRVDLALAPRLRRIEDLCYAARVTASFGTLFSQDLAHSLRVSAKWFNQVLFRLTPKKRRKPKPKRTPAISSCTHEFKRPIPITQVVESLGEPHFCVTRKLRKLGLPIGGTRRHFVAELDHLLICFPQHRHALLQSNAKGVR